MKNDYDEYMSNSILLYRNIKMIVMTDVLEKKTVNIKVDLWWFSSSYDFWKNKNDVEFWQLSEEEIDDKLISEHKRSIKDDTFIDITDL